MDLSNAPELADFPTGWRRHKTDESIVFVSHLDIFHAAANDISCRAAILAVPEKEKARDRTIFKNAWEQSSHDKTCRIGIRHTNQQGKYLYGNGIEHYKMKGFDISAVEEPLNTMLEFYQRHNKSTNNETSFEIVSGWRAKKDEKTHAHPHKVLNRVFCSGGTVIPLLTGGKTQVPEGDLLFMRSGVEHTPEYFTANNVEQERYTVAAYVYNY